MKSIRKIVAAAMVLSTVLSWTTFAEIPNNTVIIGKMAYSLDYAENKQNLNEILNALRVNGDKDVFIKLNNTWLSNDKKAIDSRLLPQVIMKGVDGKVYSYDMQDGKELDIKAMEFGIENVGFISENTLEIKFNYPIDMNQLESYIMIDGNKINKEDIKVLSGNNVVQVRLKENLPKKDIIKNIEIGSGIKSIYGDEIKDTYSLAIMVLNGESGLIKEPAFKGNLNVLASNRSISGLEVSGNLNVQAPGVILDNVKVIGNVNSMITGGKITLKNSSAKGVCIESEGTPNVILQNTKSDLLVIQGKGTAKVEVDEKASVGRTLVNSSASIVNQNKSYGNIIINRNGERKVEVNLEGNFKNIMINNHAKLTTTDKSMVEDLIVCSLDEKIKVELGGKFNRVSVESNMAELFLNKDAKVITLNLDKIGNVKTEKGTVIENLTGNKKDTIDSSITIGKETAIGGGGGAVIPGGGGSIVVPDTVKPVIALKGESNMKIKVGEPFVDPGYTATDDRDGDITSKVTMKIEDGYGNPVDKIDTSKKGVYNITYKVKDAAGNEGEISRTVIVEAVSGSVVKVYENKVLKVTAEYSLSFTNDNYTSVTYTINLKPGVDPIKDLTMVITDEKGSIVYTDQKSYGSEEIKMITSLEKGSYHVKINPSYNLESLEFTHVIN